MKVIELLNKLANNEEVPKKIQYSGYIYELFERFDSIYTYKNCNDNYFEDEWYLTNILNNEVKIIEDTPKEEKKIEKTNREDISLGASLVNEKIRNIDCYIFDKLDEIIDKVNGDK